MSIYRRSWQNHWKVYKSITNSVQDKVKHTDSFPDIVYAGEKGCVVTSKSVQSAVFRFLGFVNFVAQNETEKNIRKIHMDILMEST